MLRKWLSLLPVLAAIAPGPAAARAVEAAPKQVVVIPLDDEIASPALYVLRRGLKEAINQKASVVVLDLKTPGGAIDTAFAMMEALEKFPGQTIAYVDNEAMSAGAFISATANEIWFTPDGVIGAAAPVTSTGQDIDATMKEKLVSYLKARMRAVSEGKGYRGQVVSAMIDANLELKIDGEVLKEKGELLSLTATEAMKTYGDPPKALLGAGIAPTIDALLTRKFGVNGFVVRRLEVTWSERLAVWLNGAAPVLLGLGLLGIFLEFKTGGGFGYFGVGGAVLLAIVFLGSYVAGFSGHEPVLIFGLGMILLLLELLFFHSSGFLGVIGAILMMCALVWSMADLWPNEPISVAWSADAFVLPLTDMGLGLAIAVALGAVLVRFLPHQWIFDRLVVKAVVGGSAQTAGTSPGGGAILDALVGQRGVAATSLRPAGQVVIAGRRYEAKVGMGTVDVGSPVVVVAWADFGLIVEPAK